MTIAAEVLAGEERLPAEAQGAWLGYMRRTVITEGWARDGLSSDDRSLIAVAALATLGCERQLRSHVRAALAEGIDRAALCEVLFQVGGYAGMGRGYDGLVVVGEEAGELGRGEAGGPPRPKEGQPADDDPAGRLARGLEVLEVLRPGRDPLSVRYPFAPDWRPWLVRTAFGDLWSRQGLTLVERERVTMAVLVALGREREFREHIGIALTLGIRAEEIGEQLMFLAVYVGFPAVVSALRIAVDVLDEKGS